MKNQPKLDLNSWVRQQSTNPNPKLRLFCFPHAGGGASVFRLWHKFLPSVIDVCPVQLPGRESRIRETPYTEMTKLIGDLSIILSPLLTDYFVFFGHSMGALVAFELTRLLRKERKETPRQLILAACPAPHSPDQPPPVHHLARNEFITALRQMDGTPEEVFEQPDLLDFFLPLLRADFQLYETYIYYRDQPLECPIAVYGGIADNGVTENSLNHWEQQTTGGFKKRMFPGNHYFFKGNNNFFFQAILEDLSSFI